MVNKVLLVGNIGKDPEIKSVGNSKVANFSLATSENIKKGEKWEKETFWHNIVLWGNQASFIESYVKKGDLLSVEGSIKYRSYNDKDGNTKYITEIKADEVKLLSHRKE